MKSIEQFSVSQAGRLRYLLCDIDDTITTDGKVTAAAYRALWDLHEAGIAVIPVTGRPAGWCDLIVRQWPVQAVIGENGAFAYYFSNQQLQTYTHPQVAEDAQQRLEQIKQRVLEEIPGTRVSKDQFCRKYDLAIDFNEDPPYLGFAVAEEIRALCQSMGAEAKVSSIHVNTWFGQYDKVSMTQLYFEQIVGDLEYQEHSLFFGDSPNDEPMFAFLPQTCAVANIQPFLDQLEHHPTYLAPAQSGEGFAQAVKIILRKRNEYLQS